ncbi:NUDIX hydrolase [Aureimonas endophytica]|uniref:NUDIX hydrolase n=1 Tax=Aureimonas endophytica TaxID=2027858 RepID=A0A916ZY05_9HYPH|nr:NUDIX domain-containing protein [Aureimonas endophytica]GGE18721.1 NUDIX hydrolase [Aureimonas endophytica]
MTRSPILGVSACLFRAGQILLVERHRPPYEGRFSLPGGRVEFGEPIASAIAREVAEETGLAIGRFVFHCLHEAIDADFHAVIAVHRAAEGLRPGTEPVAGDDARSLRFVPLEALAAMEAEGRLTDGLRRVVASAHRDHLAGL